MDKVVAGPERKSRRLGEEEKRRVAYHEVGHALVAAYSKHADPVHKISIIPHGHAALGYTHATADRGPLPHEPFGVVGQAQAACSAGGRPRKSSLAKSAPARENDLEHATALARQMVAMLRHERRGGPGALRATPESVCGGHADGFLQRDCSEQTAREIDEEVKRLLDSAYVEAKEC